MFDLKIIGTGSFIPETLVTNEMMATIVDTNDEWITSRTGISNRRLSSGEPTWYMGAEAARKALAASGIDALAIDMIVVTTITPDYYTPSTACIIQDELGAKNAFCFDMNAACTGFVYALDMAGRYLSTPGINNILIVASENISKIVDYSDRSTCVLFGDGASAAIVSRAQPGDSSALLSTVLGAEGDGGGFLVSRALDLKHPFVADDKIWPDRFNHTAGHFIGMAGQDVYKFAVRSMSDSIMKAAEKANIGMDELHYIVPHQANSRIVEAAARRMKVDPAILIQRMQDFGNTSSASIPICLDEMIREGKLKRGDKVAISGFGGGLTYGAAIFVY
ncbi:MAG: ketoacyl-ACP synthase III [Eubacteriales bacterium]|nr:ketoacyl-ACP synthase III [Eubacteriales bacterium]